VSSLDTDHYGSVYAASPSAGLVAKYSAELRPVAELSSGVERPRAFHVPFVTRRDHRDGTVKRVGEGSGLIVEEWTDHSGIRMVKMGVEVRDLRVSADHDVTADFTVTDRASVRGELVEVSTGRVVHSADFGEMGSGARTVSVPAADLDDVLYDGEYVLRLQAESPYGAETETAETSFTWNGGNVRTLPSVATLMGNDPNPFQRSTSITFAIPEGRSASYTLSVYDVTGRLVRTVASGQVEPGLHTIAWDGRDSGNREVASGVYLYRLSVGDEISTRKMVLVRR
jgi:flagellar hook assembly protein FlgD